MKSVEGIILKKTPRREADLVFEIYTKEMGLAHFQAKGVRKYSAKLKSGLDVFNHVDLFYAPSKYMPIATDFKIRNDFSYMKKNLKLLKLANFSSYIIGKIFEPGLADGKAWDRISEHFHTIGKEGLKISSAINSTYALCYQILHLNGIQPELDKCVRCGKPVLEENLVISLTGGGIAHYKCLRSRTFQHDIRSHWKDFLSTNLSKQQDTECSGKVRDKIDPYRIANATLSVSGGVLNLASQADIKPGIVLSESADEEIWADFRKLTEILFQYHFGIDVATLL